MKFARVDDPPVTSISSQNRLYNGTEMVEI